MRLAGAPLLLIAVVVSARSMSAQTFGFLSTFLAIGTILSIPTTSLERLVLREASTTDAAAATTWAWRRLGAAAGLTLAGGAAAGLVAASFGTPLPDSAIFLAAPFGALWGALRVGQSLNRAQNRYFVGQAPNELLRPIMLIIGFIGLSLTSQSKLSFEAGAGLYIGITAVLAAWTLHRFRLAPRTVVPSALRHRLRSSSLWFASTTGLSLLSDRATEIIAGFLAPGPPAGAYSLGLRFASLCAFGLSTGQFLYAPLIARSSLDAASASLNVAVKRVRQLSNAAALFFATPILLFPHTILRIVGAEFLGYTTPFRILALAGVLNAWTGPSQMVLEMSGLERVVSHSYGVSLGLNLVLAPLLIPKFGATGAAIAFTFATVAREIYLVFELYRRRRFWAGSAIVRRLLRLTPGDGLSR